METIYVCGATAVGKTSRALQLARELGGEIVNGDAFQLFRGIEVLGAAPSAEERSQAPHHLFGVLGAGASCDAGRYAEMAAGVVSAIHARGKTAIVVGGSGLYLKFLTHGASPLPRGDKALREELDARPLEEIFEELERLDPVEAAQVDRHNPRYVSRALEICLLSGKKVSELRDSWVEKTRQIESGLKGEWLIRSREDLHSRIALRTRQMLSGGAIGEVAALGGVSGSWEKAIGVKEIRRLLAGEISESECEELIIFATRQYAKRQETWFRREKWLERVQL
ncbi:tRNA (adenosine(37)-N6)-dimethylallyltransferase MiaA [Akkermansiaceae bacterium]|nr:tRNA (adenosine(37)-N6)-dimethylallyltransferase MiaA [Akkermansiaceae bacterium]